MEEVQSLVDQVYALHRQFRNVLETTDVQHSGETWELYCVLGNFANTVEVAYHG